MHHDDHKTAAPELHLVDTPEALDRIAHALKGLRFGSIEVVVQDSRVVQIERKEKFRLDKLGRRP